MNLRDYLRAAIATSILTLAVTADAIADIPAPKTEPSGTDWSFVLMGSAFAFVSALLFLWLGRKLFKRS
ncbi:MAG: hypothetical protein WBO10_15455 [Pyrinomonadaceae bacterium]